jgi:hypothetical protein
MKLDSSISSTGNSGIGNFKVFLSQQGLQGKETTVHRGNEERMTVG